MTPHSLLLSIISLFVALAFTTTGTAQVYEKVFSFTDARAEDLLNTRNKGSSPLAALVQGGDGNFYGTTRRGGADDFGTIFKTTPSGILTTLVEFKGNTGHYPLAALVLGSDGNFYGTTYEGGASNSGTIFRMTPAGVLTTLVEFTGNGASNKGKSPNGALVPGSDGNFYGTTVFGGASNFGTVFRMTPSGVLTTLVEFTGNGGGKKGSAPAAALVEGSDGNFYGTTSGGGIGGGTVFRMTPAGALATLVEFTGDGPINKGTLPLSALVQGSDGNFYGTTRGDGGVGKGTIFKMTPAGDLTTVEFTGNGASNKGALPAAALVQASDGNFYGTTTGGGANFFGTVFTMTPQGVLTTLVEFTGNGASNTGSSPGAGLVQSSDGTFYGTTQSGGLNGFGTVFRITPAGVLTTVVEFTGNGASHSGSNPGAALVQGSDGNFYGTTNGGGAKFMGTVFKMTPTGVLTTLVEFTGNGAINKGRGPRASLAQGSDGNFYGTTVFGGASDFGTIFRVTPSGVLTTLVEFTGNGPINKGALPRAALVQGSDGNFYGTTSEGGTSNFGTIFRMPPSGVLTTLVEFSGNGGNNKGNSPQAALVQGNDGDFYGTTTGDGLSYGTVFKITPPGALTTLVEFTGNAASNNGISPRGALVQGSDGNFYGTTAQGGPSNLGSIFRMTPAGVLTTLLEFTSTQGSYPFAALVQGSDGNFYGTTYRGGAKDAGTIFRMMPSGGVTTIFDFAGDPADNSPSAELIRAADGNLYGTTIGSFSSSGSTYRVVFSGTPNVYLADLQVQGSATAVASTKVNPRGYSTRVYLEYGTDEAMLEDSVAVAASLTGYQTKSVGTTLTNLEGGATYYYRFRAVSAAGETYSPPLSKPPASFLTPAEPEVTIGAATEISPTTARLNGTVNSRNSEATVSFEWGTDGNTFPKKELIPEPVTGSIAKPVSAVIGNIPKGGTVYYRLRASNVLNPQEPIISGILSFSTVDIEKTAPSSGDIGVTEATLKATINTFNQTALVRFRYWADSEPQTVLETAAQSIVTTTPTEVRARVTGLLGKTTYSYQVVVELSGTQTEGGVVTFATDENQAPQAFADLIFYSGQVLVDPLTNDEDPNNKAPTAQNEGLRLDPELVAPPNASRGAASVTADRRFISYNPQFNVLDDDELTYRVLDPSGAASEAQVRLISFSKRAGYYGGRILFGEGAAARQGPVSLQLGGGGSISTSFLDWAGESYRIKGVFDQSGTLIRALNTPSGAILTVTLRLQADLLEIHGSFEERVNGVVAVAVDFVLTRNAGTGGLAASGLRTGFLDAPSDRATVMGDGFLLMTIGRDPRRGARFVGRLPDGEPFVASAAAQGQTYALTRKLEQGGIFTGLVHTIDDADEAGGLMGDLYWKKNPSERAKYSRSGVEAMLSLSGVAYPVTSPIALPPIGLSTASPNARLQLTGGGLLGTYQDILLNVVPGRVELAGFDTTQPGSQIDPRKFQLKLQPQSATFTGRFLHPQTNKPVTFNGAFRVPFDNEIGQGRGNFPGSGASGSVRLLPQ